MNNQTSDNGRSPRRLILYSLLGLLVLAGAWITYFLATFDLNNYREQAEERFSTLFSLNVKLGNIHYNLHGTNLALHIAGVEIGDEDAALQVLAPDVMIDLQWSGLLQRDFDFTRISLVKPKAWIRSRVDEHSSTNLAEGANAPVMIDQALLHGSKIELLEIIDGAVHFSKSLGASTTETLQVLKLVGELSNLQLNQPSIVSFTGALKLPGQKHETSWRLQGETSLQLDETKGVVPYFDLNLVANDLDLYAFSTSLWKAPNDVTITGSSDLNLHLKGTPISSIEFHADLSSKQAAFTHPSLYPNPVSFNGLLTSGRLKTHGDNPGISDLSIRMGQSRLAGNIQWAPADQPFAISAVLTNSALTLPQVRKWLPDLHRLDRLDRYLAQDGSIQIENAEFLFFENSKAKKELRVNRIKGQLKQLVWPMQKTPAINISSLNFDYNGKHLTIDKGQGQMGSLQLMFKGTGEVVDSSIKLTEFDFKGDLAPGLLMEEWQIPLEPLTADGDISFRGKLEGTVDELNFDVQADMSRFSVSHPSGLKLSPDEADQLTLYGNLSPEKINLDHGAINWSHAKGRLSGSYPISNPAGLSLDALLSIDDLSALAEAIPFLKKLQLRGQADLSIKQRGLPTQQQPEMTLTLRDAGLHATRYIADLEQINGQAKVTSTGLVAEGLRVYLGRSPLTVDARLEDFAAPRLEIDVRAPSINADDLIFYSDKAMLKDIDGHLKIDRQGLSFAPVNVRLDGGTQASVTGTISFHPPFDVKLDITSEFARISEVIQLWQDRSEQSKERSVVKHKPSTKDTRQATVTINASVKSGDLYGMKFHTATGVIIPARERLVIHPLDFSVGEGYCNAQVLTDFKADGPSLLRISGHAEDVDALEVYRELLNQKNIVRGKLRGDFHVTGSIGKDYLSSSNGNFSIQIKDGVLHQFPFLSKVFSLLNVAQVFALQLPDMDLNGMPFKSLSANFQLNKGLLTSNDLVILSEAMNQSYSGQLNLVDKEVDMSLAIHPLGTVDKLVSRIPVAGWLLTGENKALLTAHFSVKGKIGKLSVQPMPLDTITEPTIGLLRRTLGLPFKLIEKPQIIWGGDATSE